ncbi:MAG: hypothetical protein LBU32_24300 [Clostridiales bacterium]|jgi:hypothetical protein|nr:hypothetical protein [Clostridiales bacterium]
MSAFRALKVDNPTPNASGMKLDSSAPVRSSVDSRYAFFAPRIPRICGKNSSNTAERNFNKRRSSPWRHLGA